MLSRLLLSFLLCTLLLPVGELLSRAKDSPIVATVKHGDRGGKRIALTFDACSTHQRGKFDDRITRVLVDSSVAATIFVGGKWAEENREHLRYLVAHPQFELGNHTYSHPHLTHLPDGEIRRELRLTERVLHRLTGIRSSLFRPPYGEYDERVVRAAATMGMTTVEYDLASGDPDTSFTREKLIRYIAAKTRGGSIIVMHINRRGWHTAEALPGIIGALRRKGFVFVTVGELIGIRVPERTTDEPARTIQGKSGH